MLEEEKYLAVTWKSPIPCVSNIQICALDNIKGSLIAFFNIQRKIQTAPVPAHWMGKSFREISSLGFFSVSSPFVSNPYCFTFAECHRFLLLNLVYHFLWKKFVPEERFFGAARKQTHAIAHSKLILMASFLAVFWFGREIMPVQDLVWDRYWCEYHSKGSVICREGRVQSATHYTVPHTSV